MLEVKDLEAPELARLNLSSCAEKVAPMVDQLLPGRSERKTECLRETRWVTRETDGTFHLEKLSQVLDDLLEPKVEPSLDLIILDSARQRNHRVSPEWPLLLVNVLKLRIQLLERLVPLREKKVLLL